MRQREGYYAALERQRAGETTLRDRFNQREQGRERDEFEALENVYTEVGMKAFTAFNNCLDWLAHLGGNGSHGARFERPIREAVSSVALPIQEAIGEMADRVARIESSLASLEAGMRRIDKFTMDAFRNLQEIEERFEESAHNPSQEVQLRGRLAKEDAAEIALEAAAKMQADGKRLTLASVAREAGLKYGQIVYAFGNKEGFFKALAESNASRPEGGVEESAALNQAASAS